MRSPSSLLFCQAFHMAGRGVHDIRAGELSRLREAGALWEVAPASCCLTHRRVRAYQPAPRNQWFRAISSAGEHCLHTAGVTGSIPVSPTIPCLTSLLRCARPRRGGRLAGVSSNAEAFCALTLPERAFRLARRPATIVPEITPFVPRKAAKRFIASTHAGTRKAGRRTEGPDRAAKRFATPSGVWSE